jgi:hypothetical protein
VIERKFFWVNPDEAIEAANRMGLAAFGAMGAICALAYTRDTFLPAGDDAATALEIHCSVEEWKEIKDRLLEGGDIVIRDDLVLPAAQWAKPELDG